MVRKATAPIWILFLCVTCLTVKAQDSLFLSKAISNLGRQPAQETTYLHLNKANYLFGDTVWFKAYTVIGTHHQLSALSGVLYVELISPKDSVISCEILHLQSGVTWGDIPLAKTLKQGNYRIRAYTNWMRNEGPNYFYNHVIRLGGMAPSTAKQTTANPDVQFFPEGGQLVEGIRSRVAVKSVNSNGFGENIAGTILDNNGNVVADFATKHLGMGVFAFIPQPGKTYKAHIKSSSETTFDAELPKAGREGYTLSINNSQHDSIYIKVAVNEKAFNNLKNSTFYIIAQNSSKVYYTAQGKLENLVYSARVEKSRFPSGITQFTLFSQNDEPIAERIAYIEGNDTLKLSIATQAANYTTHQDRKIDLKVTNDKSNPATGTFSVAVINESIIGTDENTECTIMNNLLLTSDLKGYIEQPNYYFTNSNDQTRADLDNLMLTQGYRRFEWKQILDTAMANTIKYLPEKSLELAGILKTPSGKPIPNGKITLIAAQQNILRDTTADANGNFRFTNLYLTDTAILVLRARKENNGGNVQITTIQPDYPLIIKARGSDTVNGLSQGAKERLQQQYNTYKQLRADELLKYGKQLKQVEIKGYVRKEPDLSQSASLHPGGADQVIMGDQLGPGINLSDRLRGRAFGISFAANGGAINHQVGTKPNMSVIVDGNILSSNSLNDVNGNDVYSIEVLRSTHACAIYGSSIEGGGALVITMKHGGESGPNAAATPAMGLSTLRFAGYYKTRAFYSPKYNSPKTNAQQPGNRTTIYWNPNIITDKDGKASFEYYNADTKCTYRIVVEGIDEDGKLGRAVYRYKVE